MTNQRLELSTNSKVTKLVLRENYETLTANRATTSCWGKETTMFAIEWYASSYRLTKAVTTSPSITLTSAFETLIKHFLPKFMTNTQVETFLILAT